MIKHILILSEIINMVKIKVFKYYKKFIFELISMKFKKFIF